MLVLKETFEAEKAAHKLLGGAINRNNYVCLRLVDDLLEFGVAPLFKLSIAARIGAKRHRPPYMPID